MKEDTKTGIGVLVYVLCLMATLFGTLLSNPPFQVWWAVGLMILMFLFFVALVFGGEQVRRD